MSPSDEPRDARRDAEGGTAPPHGTPVPVDLSADRAVRLTWAVFITGPIVWITHFMVVYLVAEAGCTGGGEGLRIFDPPVPVLTTLVATVIAVALCVAATVWAYREWRASEDQLAAAPDAATELSGEFDDDRRRGSLAFAGFLLSAFSVVAVLFVGAPALVLGPC
ncbi:MAG: hypothetical protein M3N57_03790 [Actinomycetota bacterium]|nr:hypothetical protein [Actinomycetota bacterium]